MGKKNIEAYVKYNRCHIDYKNALAPNPFVADAINYNTDGDCNVCPMKQKMERICTKRGKIKSRYINESAHYRLKNWSICPLYNQCLKGTGNRVIEVTHSIRKWLRINISPKRRYKTQGKTLNRT